MYATYLKLAFRNLLKNKTFSAINLLGLTTGTVCCLYILLYVQDQRSYDKHHHEAGNLFRITTELNLPDGNDIMPMLPEEKLRLVGVAVRFVTRAEDDDAFRFL